MRRFASAIALALVFGACANGSSKDASPTTRRSTTTKAAPSTTASTTTTLAAPPAPNGCDASSLKRVEPRRDRTKYTIDATLDLAANQVRGSLRALFTPDKATDRIVMRLWPNGPTTAAGGGRMDLGDATLDGRPVALSLVNATTAVAATGPIPATTAQRFAVNFVVTLPRDVDERLSRVGTTVRLGSWLPLLPWEPGAGWTLDPPTTSNAEASTSIHADFDVHLVTPPGLTVLASGTDRGDRTWSASAVPDWAASIGDFTVARGLAGTVPVVVGVDKTLNDSAAMYLSAVTPALTELARRYGAYPWPAYTLAITPKLKGGIEYPGHVMQGPGTNSRTLSHEIAHQWFYALVGSDQGRDPWIDEGLASWAEAQVETTYRSFLAKPIPAGGAGRMGEAMPYWDQRHGAYYRSVYVQPVHALGALGVSTAAVDCALARFVAANAYRVAVPSSVVDALKTVAPNAEAVIARFGGQRLRAAP
ncbi:MAG: hypothetical protein H0U92_14985 [Actinobacteria bacterium]|nr:hypothetical protein [Actinomycetota bacterium]